MPLLIDQADQLIWSAYRRRQSRKAHCKTSTIFDHDSRLKAEAGSTATLQQEETLPLIWPPTISYPAEATTIYHHPPYAPRSTSRNIPQTQPINVLFTHYSFLAVEPLSHIPSEDFNYLEAKGCFHLPSRPILDEFIKEYFLHVHPTLPILNERLMWEMFLGEGRIGLSTNKFPLFLFRSILFASCSVSHPISKRVSSVKTRSSLSAKM